MGLAPSLPSAALRPAAVRGLPNAKPRVERSFWEHERSFLNGRSFRDLADFSAQLALWLDRVVDPRPRRGGSALDRFPEEAPHLLPLPGGSGGEAEDAAGGGPFTQAFAGSGVSTGKASRPFLESRSMARSTGMR